MDLFGILPAAVLPFTEKGQIDEEGLIKHLSELANVNGVKGIVCNAHAGEGTSLTNDERSKVLKLAKKHVSVPIISGVVAEGTDEVVEQAKVAEKAGADALLVMPPHGWGIYGKLEPEMPYNFFKAICDAVSTPILIFQYRAWSPASYSVETLLKLADLPNVIGMKNAVNDLTRHELEYRVVKKHFPDFAFLTAHDKHLLPTFVLGCDGALIGFAALAAKAIADMFNAVKRNDLAVAKDLHDKLIPLRDFIYKEPFGLCHSRIKQALVYLGKIKTNYVRGPLVTLRDEEIKEMETVLAKCKENGIL